MRGWFAMAVGLLDTVTAVWLFMLGEQPPWLHCVLAVGLTLGGAMLVATDEAKVGAR